MKKQLWSVDVPWACFGLVVENGVVVEAANIAGWSTGKDVGEVLLYYVRKGGKVEVVERGFCGIVSGGQTGADRGGLDAAIEMDVDYCGWVPLGRRAEDGRVPDIYKLSECRQDGYKLRTEINVAFCSGVVIFTYGPLTGGSKLTYEFAVKQGKPWMWIDLNNQGEYGAVIAQFITDNSIRYLMVAGNRESKAPGIHAQVKTIMMQTLARVA